MKHLRIVALIVFMISSPLAIADLGNHVLQLHNDYVKHLMEAKTKSEKCSLMLETMHPDQIKLTAAYEYANYIFNQVVHVWQKEYEKTKLAPGGKALLTPLKSNDYKDQQATEKYRAFCNRPDSRTFNLEKYNNYLNAQKIFSKTENEIVLEAHPPNNKNKTVYYFWKTDSKGKWKFFNGSLSPKPYPEVSEASRDKIVNILAKMNGAEVVFNECFKMKNNVFNADDARLMLTVIYNKPFNKIIGNKKSDLQAAIDNIVTVFKKTIKQPKACDSDKARGQLVSAEMNFLQQAINKVYNLSSQ